jgi:peptidyl-prolyl cis-trans isomerase A (cyclophilin A)
MKIQLVLIALILVCSCKTQQGTTGTRNVKLNKTYTTPSGIKYVYTQLGEGARAKNGDKVFVHSIGRLTDGKEFDNTYKKGQPTAFVLGEGKVIKGWDEGIALLNEGDKATLTIPAELGYGAVDVPGLLPANSVLIFDVELVKLEPAEKN